jgi:hypothetical protein
VHAQDTIERLLIENVKFVSGSIVDIRLLKILKKAAVFKITGMHHFSLKFV